MNAPVATPKPPEAASPPPAKHWTPHGASIARQLLVVMALALLAMQTLDWLVLLNMPPPQHEAPRMAQIGERLSVLLPEIAATAPGKRAHLVAQQTDPDLTFRLERRPPIQTGGADRFTNVVAQRLAERLGVPPAAVQITSRTRSGFLNVVAEDLAPTKQEVVADAFPLFSNYKLAVQVAPESWIVVRPQSAALRAWMGHIGVWFLVSSLLLGPMILLFARRLAAPIGQFADAAEHFGRRPGAPLLAEEGPQEVRAAVRAFNSMQERIRRFLEDRTLMLAAVSHDLRTPLQRLRFRVDSLPTSERLKILRDIEQMEAMIAATLAFARDETSNPRREQLDLGALVESICDDVADAGGAVSCYAEERIVIQANSLALKRAVENLIGNAIKYAGAAQIRVSRQREQAVVAVEDRGPGIPADMLEMVFQPFQRLEPSRSRSTGGAGLGLAIARTVARGHGGDVTLEARPGGGLIARLALPT